MWISGGRIGDVVSFFVGDNDDYSLADYLPIANSVYGSGFATHPPDEIADHNAVAQVLNAVQALPRPLIHGAPLLDLDGDIEPPRTFLLMSQKFVPDSYMFQQLVYPVSRQNNLDHLPR